MGRKHKLDEVLRELSRKSDVRVAGANVMVLSDKIIDKKGNTIDNPFNFSFLHIHNGCNHISVFELL